MFLAQTRFSIEVLILTGDPIALETPQEGSDKPGQTGISKLQGINIWLHFFPPGFYSAITLTHFIKV
jgi:hypothetical protein